MAATFKSAGAGAGGGGARAMPRLALAAMLVLLTMQSVSGACSGDNNADGDPGSCVCKAGFYGTPTTTGASGCAACPTGAAYGTTTAGSTQCTCASGYAWSSVSSTCVLTCTDTNSQISGEGDSCVCQAGFYGTPTASGNSGCIAQSATCGAGKYYSAAAGGALDRVCTDCPAGSFLLASELQPSTYISAGTTVRTLQDATACHAQAATCGAGKYYSAAAGGALDRVCTPCDAGSYSSAASTPSTYYTSGTTQRATTTSSSACTLCPATAAYGTTPAGASQCTCASGRYWSSGACVTATTSCSDANSQVNSADTGCVCKAGFFGTPTTSGNSGCIAQSDTCGAGKYYTAAAGGTSDRVCTDCPAGSFLLASELQPSTYFSTGTTVRSYQDATACHTQAATCGAGKYYSAAAGGALDRVCTDCGAGTYSALSTPTVYGANAVLTACPSQAATCGAGKYYSAAATSTADRMCTDCPAGSFLLASELQPSTYISAGTTVRSYQDATACHTQAATCAAGTFYAIAATTTADRTCTPCGAGTFAAAATPSTYATTIAASCPSQSATCAAGTFYATAATTTADRVCTPCGAGTFAAASTPSTYYTTGTTLRVTATSSTACVVCPTTSAYGSTPAGSSACVCAQNYYASVDANSNPVCLACSAAGAGQRVLAVCAQTSNTVIASCAYNTFSVLGVQSAACPTCSICSGDKPVTLEPCLPTADTICGAAGASPSKLPKQAPIAASPSATPGTTAVAGALALTSVSLSALADPHVLDLLTTAISASVQASLAPGSASVSVAITSITDIATGVAIFAGAGAASRRRLQAAGSQGVTVAYNVLLPSGVLPADVQGAILPGGTGAASFVQAVTHNIATAAAASPYAAISSGLGSVSAAAASPPVAPATTSSAPSVIGAAVGGAVGGLVLVLLIVGVYRFCCMKPAAVESAAAETGPNPHLTVRVVDKTSSPRSSKVAPSSASSGTV